ncbi:hypothetical protein MN116_000852 [Schistosoma mekongi]|uniref:Glycerol-3-phosphate dehydrogenase NAD-dependent N-terminal domain-containing protein n=1 Tax=Schistosoma mekongi TaxID=38744 RepID=A0AAE1ZLI6_SCHME|nr:hypothetical protein MN116_000852 [Schistosoma mekongi]
MHCTQRIRTAFVIYEMNQIQGLVLCPKENQVKLVSDNICEQTGKHCVVVSGATIALEVTKREFTEVTIGSKCYDHGCEVKRLLQELYILWLMYFDVLQVHNATNFVKK